MLNKLAIVIPAYKQDFFEETLESIVNQSCNKFTLYIGDDASPNDLYNIIKKFENRINIIYKRFDINLGKKDLVAHWKRCIDLVRDEEWIWFFSDDDLMEYNCVEEFYLRVKKDTNIDLIHFNAEIIDQFSKTIKICEPFPEIMSVNDFFEKRIRFTINSFIVDYIFKKNLYNRENGFENFDMAWCSDDATWIKFGKQSGIYTIQEAKIKWRYSGANISSILNNKIIIQRKLNSNISYIKWVNIFFTKNNIVDKTSYFNKFKWIVVVLLTSPVFTYLEKYRLIINISDNLGYKQVKKWTYIYWLSFELKSKLTYILTSKK